ncbi:hypothetical protein ACOSQ2_032227 [Xanthoceras sorbifolium]
MNPPRNFCCMTCHPKKSRSRAVHATGGAAVGGGVTGLRRCAIGARGATRGSTGGATALKGCDCSDALNRCGAQVREVRHSGAVRSGAQVNEQRCT